MATPANLTSMQTLQAQVAGPAGATRAVFVTGLARCGLAVDVPSPGGGTASRQGTFAAHVGPSLTVAQFRRAVAMASLASLSASGNVTVHAWAVTAVDANFDDDAGQVRLGSTWR
jgi:hypothetical protein